MLLASNDFFHRRCRLSVNEGEFTDVREIPRDIELPPIDSIRMGERRSLTHYFLTK